MPLNGLGRIAPPPIPPARGTSCPPPPVGRARAGATPSGVALSWPARDSGMVRASRPRGGVYALPGSAPPVPGSAAGTPAAPRLTAFRRVHHWHVIPGPTNLLGWDDPSRSGDHYAISRYATAFSLQFDQLGRVIGLVPAHLALGAVAGMLFGLGVRQGIHSMMITTRGLRRLGREGKMIAAATSPHGTDVPVYLRALARRNRHLKWSMRYGLALDLSATIGSLALGVGTLFRRPLLGEFSASLLHAAKPVLVHAFYPLVLPSGVAAVERTSRSLLTLYKTRAISRHLETVDDPRANEVGVLYRKRQRELRKYFVQDAAARAALVTGATISVFIGPGGLLVLVPAILAVINSECFARRVLNVDDTFPLKERLTIRTDEDYFTAILKADVDATSVQALRQARRKRYPWGWGTAWRPLIRLYRNKCGERHGNTEKSAQVLAAFDRRDTKIGRGPVPPPTQVMEIMDDARARALFAEAILRDKKLRAALNGHGVTMVGRKWSVDADVVAMFMMETRWNGHWSQKTVDDLYQLAEEVLLTKGRVELRRRLRALLDYYGRFARATLRLARKKGKTQRLAMQRKDS